MTYTKHLSIWFFFSIWSKIPAGAWEYWTVCYFCLPLVIGNTVSCKITQELQPRLNIYFLLSWKWTSSFVSCHLFKSSTIWNKMKTFFNIRFQRFQAKLFAQELSGFLNLKNQLFSCTHKKERNESVWGREGGCQENTGEEDLGLQMSDSVIHCGSFKEINRKANVNCWKWKAPVGSRAEYFIMSRNSSFLYVLTYPELTPSIGKKSPLPTLLLAGSWSSGCEDPWELW